MPINVTQIMADYRAARNTGKAEGMKAYMKHQFDYLGLQKPERVALRKDFLSSLKTENRIDWEIIRSLWDQPEREFQYLALACLDTMKARLEEKDIDRLKWLILTKSWWDSVDSIAPLVGYLNKKYPRLKPDVISGWIDDPNMWLKRVSIIFQLKYKAETDTAFLGTAILKNCGTKEFFINKAIGWALREYSKTDPGWVRHFISQHPLHSLSVREGSKYVQ